jgi:protein TonB
MFFEPVSQPETNAAKRSVHFLAVLGIHVLVAGLLVTAATRPVIQQAFAAVKVRLIESRPEAPPQIEPPKPRPTPPPKKIETRPPPIMVASQPTSSVSTFSVAPQPADRVVDTAPTPAPPAPVTPARFDAAYLQNPKPVYPAISRRQEEQGRVVLRVRVSEQGAALSVEIKQSSGFVRLDDAARSAVERWRFVPAKQGSEAIEAWVLVPLHFTLDS